MSKSYVKTVGGNDTTALLLKKMDELIAAYASLKASHAAIVGKLALEVALTQGPYADSSVAAPVTAASELIGS